MASVKVLRDPADVRRACDEARARGLRVGLVPTMGALHEGHLALVRDAKRRASFVVCSIFVNPAQFGPNEDLARYPRDLEGDVRKLGDVAVVFAPEPSAMYLPGEQTRVRVEALSASLCGPCRPGHFEGVATVVAKLFAIVGPAVAIFGKKDYQQLAILRRMAADLFFPIEVVGHAIVRESDGLAMSSRNAYLSSDERARALSLSRGLSAALGAFEGGERRVCRLRELALASIAPAVDAIDYVTVADADALVPLSDDESTTERALLAVAVRVGSTRLIDNVVLGEDPSPVPA